MMIKVFILQEFDTSHPGWNIIKITSDIDEARGWRNKGDDYDFEGPFPLYIPPQVQE